MTFSVNYNSGAFRTHNNILETEKLANHSLNRLSSGRRVASARDDAASLSVASALRSEIAGLEMANTNASQAASMLQIADGALSTIEDILIRMKNLSVQASSEHLGKSAREKVFNEFKALREEIDRIVEDSDFHGHTLLNGASVPKSEIRVSDDTGSTNPLNRVEIANKDKLLDVLRAAGLNDDDSLSLRYTYANNTDTTKKITVSIENAGGQVFASQTVDVLKSGSPKGYVDLEHLGLRMNRLDDLPDNLPGGGAAGAAAGAAAAAVNIVTAGVFEFQASKNIAPTGQGGTLHLEDTINHISSNAAKLNGFQVTDGGEKLREILENSNVASGAISFQLQNTAGADKATVRLLDAENNVIKTINMTGTNIKNANPHIIEELGIQFTVPANAILRANDIVNVGNIGHYTTVNRGDGEGGSTTFQIGAGNSKQDRLTVALNSSKVNDLSAGLAAVSDFSTGKIAGNTISNIEEAIEVIRGNRFLVGVYQNRLDYAQKNLRSAIENNKSALSSLVDSDMASEMAAFTSRQILMQAGMSMLGKANQKANMLLTLLR